MPVILVLSFSLVLSVSGPLTAQLVPPNDPSSLTPLYEQALADSERDLGPTHPRVARRATDLGLFLKAIGRPDSAEGPLRKALRIDEVNHDPTLAADQENLASVLETIGNDAIGKHREAIDLFHRAAQGTDAAVAARSLTNLTALDPAHAESYYRDAIKAQETASGPDDPKVAVLLNDLALQLRLRNDNPSAEPLFKRALAIQEKALGHNHPATASTLNNLASLLQDMGKLADAERMDRDALGIFERKLGPESKELATTCGNLADVLWTKGDRSSAATLYRRALAMDESIFGPDHPQVANDLANLGSLLKEIGDAAAGDSLLRRALAIYEKTLGPNSAEATHVRKSLRTLAR